MVDRMVFQSSACLPVQYHFTIPHAHRLNMQQLNIHHCNVFNLFPVVYFKIRLLGHGKSGLWRWRLFFGTDRNSRLYLFEYFSSDYSTTTTIGNEMSKKQCRLVSWLMLTGLVQSSDTSHLGVTLILLPNTSNKVNKKVSKVCRQTLTLAWESLTRNFGVV